jgi:hypothetical protein
MFQTVSIPQVQLISLLSTLRQEWQEAAQGQSLLDMEANVGLMLADLVNSLGLSVQEQTLVLGPELYAEMQTILDFEQVQ